MKQNFLIRQYDKDDEGFVFSTYLKNNWYSKENTSTLKKETWENCQRERLKKIIADKKVKIVCMAAMPDVICGYAFPDDHACRYCSDKHFAYIKPQWRDKKYVDVHQLIIEKLEENNEQR